MTPVQSATSQGFVISADEGERLAHFADAGEIFIGAVSYTHLTLPTNREV